jgi:hypothetical protein
LQDHSISAPLIAELRADFTTMAWTVEASERAVTPRRTPCAAARRTQPDRTDPAMVAAVIREFAST